MDLVKFLSPDVGAIGILVLVVMLILLGFLLPRTTVRTVMESKDQQIELYKSAYQDSMEAIRIRDRQIEQLMDMARTTSRVIEALPNVGSPEGRPGHEEDPDDVSQA